MAKKGRVPDLELIKDVSLAICKEFVVYAKCYYDAHKDAILLQQISKSVDMYERLFRETVYTLLCLKRKTKEYDIVFLKPFVRHLEEYLLKERLYQECVKYNIYYATMLDRMIDEAVFRMMMQQADRDKINTKVTELVKEIKAEEEVIDGSNKN